MHTAYQRHAHHRGMTLVELLVALAIGLVVSLAAVTALVATRRGFNTVDASSQLRDNGRFASDLIQRIVVQAGFISPYFEMAMQNPMNMTQAKQDDAAGNIAANVTGFNNSTFPTGSGSSVTTATARTAGTLGYGSDVLIVRYQTAGLNDTAPTSTSPSDGTMIDCTGTAISLASQNINDRMVSIFYVDTGTDGEPTLFCSTANDGGTVANGNVVPNVGFPILSGVESFQVLYGVDDFGSGDTAGTAFTSNNVDTDPIASGQVPRKYLRADQIMVGSATASKATYDNWRHVRSIRIGMVLRGPPGSQQERVTQTFYPLGKAANSSGGSTGSALSDSTNDPGTVFTPAIDGRLRQVVTFTVHLRNDQSLCALATTRQC